MRSKPLNRIPGLCSCRSRFWGRELQKIRRRPSSRASLLPRLMCRLLEDSRSAERLLRRYDARTRSALHPHLVETFQPGKATPPKPKQRSDADRSSTRLERILSPDITVPPKSGRCAACPAQSPGLGGIGTFEQRIRAFLPQRLCLGEKRWHNIPAWEKRREGPSHLPAGTPEAFSAQKSHSLPRRDLVQIRAAFGAWRADILPSKDDVPGMTHNVPAWENFCSHIPLILPSQDNARAQTTQYPGLGGLLPPDAPASPKQGRCADRRSASTQLRRITTAESRRLPKTGQCTGTCSTTSRFARTMLRETREEELACKVSI